jgi:hypothetical protein
MQRLHPSSGFARKVAGGFAGCAVAACSLVWAAPLAAAQAPEPEPSVSVQIYRETIVRIPAAPGTISPARPRPPPPKAGRKRCINVEHVAGAIVYGDQAVEMTLSNGQRWRMYLAQGCPTLSFYQGFYYRRAQAGKLCAGRDVVIARSGGECDIVSIMPAPKAATKRR